MSRQNLQNEIDKLEAMPAMRDMGKCFEKIYAYLREIDLLKPRTPKASQASAERKFTKQNGTKRMFVEQKMKQWLQHYGTGQIRRSKKL